MLRSVQKAFFLTFSALLLLLIIAKKVSELCALMGNRVTELLLLHPVHSPVG